MLIPELLHQRYNLISRVQVGLHLVSADGALDRPRWPSPVARMGLGRYQQRDHLRHRFQDCAVWFHRGERLLHGALRLQSGEVAIARQRDAFNANRQF